MTDNELLKLAAKAAGIPVKNLSDRYDCWEETPVLIGRAWNPLADAGDALRLAVLLRIDIKHYSDHVVCWWNDFFGTGVVLYDGDPGAATRRAIVMAAAEMGAELA